MDWDWGKTIAEIFYFNIMERTMELKDLSLVELKAGAYDILAQLQGKQNELNIINAEISKRNAEAQKAEEKP